VSLRFWITNALWACPWSSDFTTAFEFHTKVYSAKHR